MVSFSKPAGSPDLEATLRLVLLLNNSIALALSFATEHPMFIVVGSLLAVSLLFNLLVLLLKIRSNRLSSKNDDDDDQKQCPSLLALGMDILGAVAFSSLYVCSTIETATRSSWRWEPILMMAYASIGTLVAFVVHGWLALRNLQRYIRYRQSLTSRCPHCYQQLGFKAAGIALPPSPIEQAEPSAQPRQSFSANSDGENEGDMLIMKASS